MNSINECVARGAEWLDENHPGWEGHIDLARLQLNNGCRCVLGQLDKAVNPAKQGKLLGDLGDFVGFLVHAGKKFEWAASHGFLAPGVASSTTIPHEMVAQQYRDLDEAWISLIKERHDTGNLSDMQIEEDWLDIGGEG